MAGTHQATQNVVAIVDLLFDADRWMNTSEVGSNAGISRDTAKRVLAELRTQGWVKHADRDGQSAWQLALRLSQLGLAHQARLVARMRELRREHDELIGPAEALLEGKSGC